MIKLDVTSKVCFGDIDSEQLALRQCICGAKFGYWNASLSIYEDDPWECPHCKRKLFFSSKITVYEVIEGEVIKD